MHRRFSVPLLIVLVSFAGGCGGSKESKKDQGSAEATNKAAPDGSAPAGESDLGPAPPLDPMGAAKVSDFNYTYGKGAQHYKKVEAAVKKGDWQAVKAACEAAIAVDPWHLHAHRTLANALARLGETQDIARHLGIALAGDWPLWGPKLLEDPALAEYLSTAEGRAVKALDKAYGEEFTRRAKAGILLVGRRSRYSRPTKAGQQWSTSRGELFAYDEQSQRYLRLTHTGEAVTGWLRAPTGEEIAYLTYSSATVPSEPGAPLLGGIKVGLLSTATMLESGNMARLGGDFARVDLQYRTGDELVVSVHKSAPAAAAPAPETKADEAIVDDVAPEGEADEGADDDDSGDDDDATEEKRPGLAEATLEPDARYTLDKSTFKLTRSDVPSSDEPSLVMTLERTWIAESSTEDLEQRLTDAGIEPPKGATISGLVWSPDNTRVVVRTVADRCAAKPIGSLYAGEANGQLKHVLRGNSEFGARWLDGKRFIFEDDAGNLRIYDATVRTQTAQLKNPAGLALVGLGARAAQVLLCSE